MIKKMFLFLLLFLCVGLFCISGKSIYENRFQNTYQEVQEIKKNPKKVALKNETGEVDLSYLTQLKKENEDTKGWISIPGTKVDYPVMYHEDPLFYHRRNFKKEKDINGSIYLDERTPMEDEKDVLILYGHNMKSGLMFGEIENYKDHNFLKKHQKIILDQETERRFYQVIAYFKLNGPMEKDNFLYEALETNNHDIILENINEKAVQKDLEVLHHLLDLHDFPKWIGLLSCDDENNNERIMVLGIME